MEILRHISFSYKPFVKMLCRVRKLDNSAAAAAAAVVFVVVIIDYRSQYSLAHRFMREEYNT